MTAGAGRRAGARAGRDAARADASGRGAAAAAPPAHRRPTAAPTPRRSPAASPPSRASTSPRSRHRARRPDHQGRRARGGRQRRRRSATGQAPRRPAAQLIKGGGAALARYMDESRSIPTATSFRTLTVTALDERRKQLKDAGRRVSFTHLIAYAIARVATDDMPVMAHHFAEIDGKPHRIDDGAVNLGLAVDVEKKDGTPDADGAGDPRRRAA